MILFSKETKVLGSLIRAWGHPSGRVSWRTSLPLPMSHYSPWLAWLTHLKSTVSRIIVACVSSLPPREEKSEVSFLIWFLFARPPACLFVALHEILETDSWMRGERRLTLLFWKDVGFEKQRSSFRVFFIIAIGFVWSFFSLFISPFLHRRRVRTNRRKISIHEHGTRTRHSKKKRWNRPYKFRNQRPSRHEDLHRHCRASTPTSAKLYLLHILVKSTRPLVITGPRKHHPA